MQALRVVLSLFALFAVGCGQPGGPSDEPVTVHPESTCTLGASHCFGVGGDGPGLAPGEYRNVCKLVYKKAGSIVIQVPEWVPERCATGCSEVGSDPYGNNQAWCWECEPNQASCDETTHIERRCDNTHRWVDYDDC